MSGPAPSGTATSGFGRWREIREAFNRVADLPVGEQGAWLAELRRQDPNLEEELRSLLRADQAQGFTLLRLAEELSATTEELAQGSELGPYRLLRRLGRGGMSTVYLAVREEGQFQKQVAIKVLRPELATADLRRRFERERQILASLDHPNIAHWFDGGTSSTGSPYLVMEYVDGLHIDEFCRRHGLSIAERVRLFQQVCAGVQHAHQNLIVHRDLKPSNVLVTATGEPKLLDFGIAKLVNPELSHAAALVTAPAMKLLTAAYASPEQLRGEPITTASDLYSLGVLLFELLVGERPFACTGKTAEQARLAVLENEAPSPREVSRRLGRPPVARDLDAIVRMALRKEPRHRYSSASALAEDLSRFLEHQPVQARKGRFAYRAGKALRRNPLVVTLATGVAFFAGVMAWQAVWLRSALEQARLERGRAEKVSSFLVGMFEVADPSVARVQEPTARELLAAGRLELERELSSEPALAAQLLETWGSAQQNLGLYEAAGRDFERALKLRRSALEDPLALAATLSRLGFLRLHQGDSRAARRLYDEALSLRRAAAGAQSLEVADSLHHLAELTQFEGHFTAAEPLFREALELRSRLAPSDFELLADSHGDLGYLLYDLGKHPEAEALLRQAIALWEQAGQAGTREHAACLDSLATVLQAEGRLNEAESLFREALEIQRRLFAPLHPDIARSLLDLGFLLQQKGDPAGAEELLRGSIDLYRQLGGDHRAMLGSALSYLAALREKQGRLPEATALYRETLELYRAVLAPDHPFLAAAEEALRRTVTAPARLQPARSRSNGQSRSKESAGWVGD